MKFKNKNHRALYEDITNKISYKDNETMAVIYLLTADKALWTAAKQHLENGKINLNRIKVRKGNENSYILLCCAKDLVNGSNFLSIGDLADTNIINSKIYSLVINAMTIKRGFSDIKKYIRGGKKSVKS